MNLKKIRQNKWNITYIIVGVAIIAMSVTNCGRKGSKYAGPFHGGKYCEDYGRQHSQDYAATSDPNMLGDLDYNYPGSNQHRYKCEDGRYTGSSWNGMQLTTANPSGRETLRITNKDVFNNFLELLGVCANSRWSGLHAQLVIGSHSCGSAVENLRLGFNVFLDYNPQQDSYAEADAYVWHKQLTQLGQLEPWVIQEGRFTRVNEDREFEIIYDLFSERHTNLKIRVNGSPEDLEDCNNASFTVSFANQQIARGNMFLSDSSCYRNNR